jgi:hypothetical protein
MKDKYAALVTYDFLNSGPRVPDDFKAGPRRMTHM